MSEKQKKNPIWIPVNYDVVVTLAAGNSGPSQYTLHWPNDSYNAIGVAAANDGDQIPVDRSNDTIADFSSRVPTPLGRRKPDVTAPGVNITTTALGGGWATASGTSFAAPHVAGALLLSWDHGMWHPALLKAWIVNSAEDKAGTGWDVVWGWGYIDLSVAWNQYDAVMIGSINPYSNQWYYGTMNYFDKATIAWLKHDGQSLVDLDLYLYDANTGTELSKSESTRDNVEQVQLLSSGSNRPVYIRVHRWGGSGSETYGFAPPRTFQATSAPPWWTGGAPARVSLAHEAKKFALYSNYPNPFNPDTWIPYQLAAEAEVIIRIYDVEGHLVRTLTLGKQPVGTYVTRDKAAYWDGKNAEGSSVASGVYFYMLEVNRQKIDTRKMVMQK